VRAEPSSCDRVVGELAVAVRRRRENCSVSRFRRSHRLTCRNRTHCVILVSEVVPIKGRELKIRQRKSKILSWDFDRQCNRWTLTYLTLHSIRTQKLANAWVFDLELRSVSGSVKRIVYL